MEKWYYHLNQPDAEPFVVRLIAHHVRSGFGIMHPRSVAHPEWKTSMEDGPPRRNP
jgi:hypothetical protein